MLCNVLQQSIDFIYVNAVKFCGKIHGVLFQGADDITYFSLHGDLIHVPDPEIQLVCTLLINECYLFSLPLISAKMLAIIVRSKYKIDISAIGPDIRQTIIRRQIQNTSWVRKRLMFM